MVQLEVAKDPRLSRLEGLVGGKLVTGNISDGSSNLDEDPDEDSTSPSGVIVRSTDPIDALGYVCKMDPTAFGILTGCISPLILHESDEKANFLDRKAKKRTNSAL